MADLARCARCQAWTLVDKTGPVAVAVDVTPTDRDGYIAAIMGGIGRYRAVKRQNGAIRLTTAPLGSPVSFDDATGAQTGTEPVHVAHPCPAGSQKVIKAEAVKPPPVCDQWRATGWTPARPCPRSMGNTQIQSCAQCEPPPFAPPLPAGQSSPEEGWSDQVRQSRGPDGSPHPPKRNVGEVSDLQSRKVSPYPVCGTCGRNIRHGETYWGISHGPVWIMAEHETCPRKRRT